MMRRLSDSSSSDENDDDIVAMDLPIQHQIKSMNGNHLSANVDDLFNKNLSNVNNYAKKERYNTVKTSSNINNAIHEFNDNSTINNNTYLNSSLVDNIDCINNSAIDDNVNTNVPTVAPKPKKKPPSPTSLSRMTGISVNQAPKFKILKKSSDQSSSSLGSREPENKKFCSEKRAEDLEKKYEHLLHYEVVNQRDVSGHVTLKNPYDLDEPEVYEAQITNYPETNNATWENKNYNDLDSVLPKSQLSPHSQTSVSSLSPKSSAPTKKSSYQKIAEEWSSLMTYHNGDHSSPNLHAWSEYSNSPHYSNSSYDRGSNKSNKFSNRNSHKQCSPDRHNRRNRHSNKNRNNGRSRDGRHGVNSANDVLVQTESELKTDTSTQTNNVSSNNKKSTCNNSSCDLDNEDEEDNDDSTQELAKPETYKNESFHLSYILETMVDPMKRAITLIKITLLDTQEVVAMMKESIESQVIAKKCLELLNNCRKTSKVITSTLKLEQHTLPREVLTVINMKLISYLSFTLYQVKKRGVDDAKRTLDKYLVGILNKGSKLPESSVVPINVTLALQSYMTTMDNLSKSHNYSDKLEEVILAKKQVAEFLAPFDFKRLHNNSSIFKLVTKIGSILQALNSTFS